LTHLALPLYPKFEGLRDPS